MGAKYISLHEAALKYNVTERKILSWAKTHEITSSQIGNTWVIDDEGLNSYLELHKKISHQNEYLQSYIEEQKEEISYLILQIDDLIYLFKSIKRISPILRLVISEMAGLISHKLRKEIFIDATLGKSISTIATERDLSIDRACYFYNSALEIVRQKLGFLPQYRNNLAEKEVEKRRLEVALKNKKNYIAYLSGILNRLEGMELQTKAESPVIPAEYAGLLSMKIKTDFQFDVRIVNCLYFFEIVTLEDLLRFINKEGFECLRKSKNFGVKSLKCMKNNLRKRGIIDDKGNSFLFEYL